MKYINGIISGLLVFALSGCFEDKGVYDYRELNAPEWKSEYIEVEARAGEIAKFESSPFFSWKGDSLARAAEVRYEWKLNGVVIGEDADFEIETDKLMAMTGITEFSTSGVNGTFSIIEKESGIAYMVRAFIRLSPTNASGDWAVLSDKSGNSKLSFVKVRRNQETQKLEFELREDIYYENYGSDIPGKPIGMSMGNDLTNIGSLGGLAVLTEEVAYDFNCENMLKVGELQEDFFALPADYAPVARLDMYGSMTTSGVHSFVAMEDGQVYRRMMTENNLGGDFATTPLVADEKGYRITHFGQSRFGFSNQLCYDEKNNRMLLLLFYKSAEMIDMPPFGQMPAGEEFQLSKLEPLKVEPGMSPEGMCPVWGFPAGSEFISTSYGGSADGGFLGPYYDLMNVFYNDASGKTRWGVCALDQVKGTLVNIDGAGDEEFPGQKLTKESVVIAGSADFNGSKGNYILYATGSAIRYVDKGDMSDHPFVQLEDAADKVTYMAYSVYRDYSYLAVATENGKLLFYDTESIRQNPELLASFDLKGEVVSVKELDGDSSNADRY